MHRGITVSATCGGLKVPSPPTMVALAYRLWLHELSAPPQRDMRGKLFTAANADVYTHTSTTNGTDEIERQVILEGRLLPSLEIAQQSRCE